jgi:hypothetical protein
MQQNVHYVQQINAGKSELLEATLKKLHMVHRDLCQYA